MNTLAIGTRRGLLVSLVCATATHASGPGESWGGFARAANRVSIVEGAQPDLALPAWTRATDAEGLQITFHGQAGVVASETRVFALGRVTPPGQGPQWRLFCFTRDTGSPCWAASIPAPVLESWSAPWYSERTQSVYMATGSYLTCVDAQTGQQRWQTPLGGIVVNASPLITDDRADANRLFITDFSTAGLGRLICINVDPFHPDSNPFAPGAIVWDVPIGSTSGNSPAYLPASMGGLGLVYVASAGDLFFGPGEILAFPVDATSTPAPVFVTPNPEGHGYYAGVCVSPPTGERQDPSVYAASYNFWGGLFSSSLVRVNASTGALAWSVPCNRTSTIPVPLPDGFVLVSGGVSGFGTVPSISLFKDNDTSAQRVWDTALDTWNDVNDNGYIDPGEYLRVGGWTIQPACVFEGSCRRAYAGVAPTAASALAPCSELASIDLRRVPASPGFIVASVQEAGASPAIMEATLYSHGAQGLRGFGLPSARLDVNGDGRVSIDDLYDWEQGRGDRDVNADGQVTQEDRWFLIGTLRNDECRPENLDG